jgi:hypothetical protein
MNGGKIRRNTFTHDGGGGGGVFIGNGGTFTMTNGEISGNEATRGGYGGVYLHYISGKFEMTGGVIYGNDVDASLRNTGAAGAAFCFPLCNETYSTAKINGQVIPKNTKIDTIINQYFVLRTVP